MGSITILYVDDEPINLMLFERMFNKKYKVLTAESGFIGLDVLKDNPDLEVVISDMKMPLMDGLEFITKAKALYPDIYYYILTGYEITIQIQESLDRGIIQKYFRKPFNMSEIEKIIEENLLIK
jgi:two-component system, response regulator, stage 0 sporulation protein F